LLQRVGHGELRDYILSASNYFNPTSRFCKGNPNEETMRQKKPTRRFDATEPTICRDLRASIIKLQAISLRVDYDFLGGDPAVHIYFDHNGKRYVSECRQPLGGQL